MKNLTLVSATLALSLLGGTAAMAAPFHDDHRHGPVVIHREPVHAWHRGDRFTMHRGSYVVVSDWNRYHLRRPPRGYHWVRSGNDYLLVAVTSGVIADLLLNAH